MLRDYIKGFIRKPFLYSNAMAHERDPLAERLERTIDDSMGDREKVFYTIGYIESEADDEVAEALDVLADYL